jgi:uncharacterized protein YrzB (UPF0473 family)
MDEPMTYEKKDEEIDGPVIYKLQDEQGNELELEALYTFDSEETGKSYIALTDNQQDEEGRFKVYAFSFSEETKNKLLPIETEEEWNLVQEVLERLQVDDDEEEENN